MASCLIQALLQTDKKSLPPPIFLCAWVLSEKINDLIHIQRDIYRTVLNKLNAFTCRPQIGRIDVDSRSVGQSQSGCDQGRSNSHNWVQDPRVWLAVKINAP